MEHRIEAEVQRIELNTVGLVSEIAILRSRTEVIAQPVSGVVNGSRGLNQLESGLQALNAAVDRCVRFSFPIKEARSMDGMIAYLTKRYGGNVQEKRIVSLRSESLPSHRESALSAVADLNTDSTFETRDKWVGWDFRDMRLHVTHYTISGWGPKSWTLEVSVDGENWAEIDRQIDNEAFRDPESLSTSSFAVARPNERGVDYRYIRLNQMAGHPRQARGTMWPTSDGDTPLRLRAVEFFGRMNPRKLRVP
jgi:hypothetical protein